MTINRVVISGNLTREPEAFSTGSGSCVLKIPVAVNDRRQNRETGEWENYPNYIDCKLFGKRAESLSTILHVGTKVCICGKIRQERWQSEAGTRSQVFVYVDEIELMTPKQTNDEKPAERQSVYEEEIPF